MTAVPQPNCPTCGASLTDSAVGGMCLRCLGQLGLGEMNVRANVASRVQRVGDYELLEEIARGGMGVVYRARQARLKRLVAIKLLLRGDLADAETRRRFELEAEAAAALQHPGIVNVFEIGESDGEHFIAMELIEGSSLAGTLRNGPLVPERAARYLHAIAEAVAYAHTRGVLHRDLKPSNVLLGADDRPRISDFGLARLADSSASLTLAGQTFGSPNYMPPEQADPFLGSATAASDVFSLGALLYHALTGRPPFVGETLAGTLRQVLESEPISPRSLRAEIDADLETICLKCLEKKPAHRYPTAHELALDLGRFLRGEPVLARPLNAPQRAWRWARRHPALASLSAGLVLALAAIAVITSVTTVRVSRSQREAEQRADESRRNLIRGLVVTGNRFLAGDDAQRALPWFLRAWELETDSGERRLHEARLGTTLRYVPELTKVWSSERRVEWVAFSPDGSRVICADGSPRVHIWGTDPADTNHITIERGGPISFARFSPDGRRILTSGEHRSMLMDVAGNKVSDSLPHELHFRNIPMRLFPLFSADGTRLLTASTIRLRLRSAENGRVLGPDISFSAPITAMAIFPDGQRCAVATADRRIAVIDGLTGQRPGPDWQATEGVRVLAVNSDGTRLAGISGGNRIYVWNLSDTNAPAVEFYHSTYTYQCEFVLGGRALLTTAYDNSARLWDTEQGRLLHVLRHDGGVYRAMEINTNGLAVSVSWDGTARAWDLTRGLPAPYPHLIHGGPVLSLDIDVAKRRILSGSWDGTVRVHTMGEGLPEVLKGRPIGSPVAYARFAALGAGTTNAALADALTGQLVSPWLPHDRRLRAFGITTNNQILATLTADGRVTVWNCARGEKLYELPITDPIARDIELTPDGRRLLTIHTNNSVRWHDAADGRSIDASTNSLPPIRSLALSPNSRHVALLGSDGRIRITQADDGRLVSGPFGPSSGAQSVVWSPDGGVIAVASGAPGGMGDRDQSVGLWDAASGREVIGELRHRDDIRAIAFSANGEWIGTGSEDYCARIWDRRTGLTVGQPLRHNGWVVAVAFNPDGKIFATGSSDGFLRLWETASGEAIGPAIRTTAEPRFLAFDEKGDSLVAGFTGYYLRWDVTLPSPMRANLSEQVTLASGMRLNAGGVLQPLSGAELVELWSMRNRHPAAREATSPQTRSVVAGN